MAKIKPIINDDTAKEPIQVFLARTTEPPKDNSNLNYRLTSAGGYNPCVRGGYSGGSRNPVGALPNCFSGDTKVITDKGIFTLKELCGTFHNVLTEDGTFHKAEFKCYGKQPLREIKFSDGHTFLCTGNHRWIIYIGDNRFERTTDELHILSNITKDLIRVPVIANGESQFAFYSYVRINSISDTNTIEDVYCCEEPVTHTMVLDGHILTGQCVGYVWGRWREILGYNHNLPRGNAKTIYRDALARGFSGSTNIPRIGSVIVWGGGTYGHVGVVENVESNGDIWVSDSNYGSVWFRYYKRYRDSGYRSLGGKSLIGFVYLPITFLDNGGFVADSVNGSANKNNILANLGSSIVGGTTIYYTNIEKSVNAMVEARNKAQQSKDTSDNATNTKPTTPDGIDKDKSDVYDDIRNNESTREEDKKIMKGSYVEFSHSSVYAGTDVSDKGYLLKDTYLQYIWNVDDVVGNRVFIGWNTKNNLRLNKWVNISDCILVPSNILNSTILKKVTNEQGAKVYLNENILNISLPITTLPVNTIVNIVIGSYKNNTYKILLNDTLRNKYSKLYGYVLAEDVDTKAEKRGQTL